ncbi:MAG TPA: ATP-binding protein [Magnetospirillaceae bacterium]|nr:ATP-binding protein [Magnetospirillaceae bacterium]
MATAAASGEKSSHESPPRSRRLSALIGITCLLAVLGGWYFLAGSLVHWLTARDIDNFVLRSRDSSDQIATNLARNMQDEVRRLANLPEALSGDLVLRAPLTGRQDSQSRGAALQEANERLRQLADQLEIDLLYVLDANGVCIATSNYQSDKSVIGTDLKARQYYTAIQNGGRGRQFAFGSASGVPGVYFSAAITRDGQFLGGVVVKRNMRNLFHLTSRNAAFLVDEYGVAVAATIEQALWHYLPDSAAAGLGTDFLQDRYRQAALTVLGIRADRSLATVSLVHLLDDPTPSLMTARPIGDSGLRLVYFTPVPDLLAMRERAQMTFWLVFVTGALILTLIAGAISYILQSRRRVTALRYSYQKLSALSRELAAEKETAQAADRAKSRFLATMSHELRTPFSGILGMVEVLRGSALPTEAMEHVSLLERSARALLGLLNDILDFSKIDAGQITVETVAFDLKPVVDDLQQIQSVVTAAKGIGLSVRGTERPLIGLGDPDRLRQILNNFLSNAIKFTALGGIEVVVQTAGEGSARRLTISVTDSGAGMASDTRDNLFKPFYQGDASTTRRHGGTGLGLAISKRIAEAMGGSIGVKSEQGQGSTFWLDVPFPENDGRPLSSDGRTDGQQDLPLAAPPPIKRRLLLADDDEVNRLVIGGMLRRIGHDVVFALDGRQAVREVTRQEFDLVIMDMHMPEMDGIEATRAIRTLSGPKARIPVIGLTADAIVENRPQYLASGLDELLTKPISSTDLAAVIRRYTEPTL